MGNRTLAIFGAAVVLIGGAATYRLATAKVNEDNRNYEVKYSELQGWRHEPKNHSTLLLQRDPKSKALLRVSATQVVDEANPEPDIDTKALVARTVKSAVDNQPEWTTAPIGTYKTTDAEFGMIRKTNPGKTIIIAIAVRGNTTFVASLSNFGEGGKRLAEGKYEPLLAFLDSVRLVESDKWTKIHEKYEELPE